ncbi:hypothetical protein [Streptomyces europaeiscabiei]|uniref:hypothetical protein n=1 Tax=Streptomyces europaeiscabiei TaxID=146819 RepID=UPI0029C9C4D1|nr:hypothetical protein [Streptomyces europaeiscabiei]
MEPRPPPPARLDEPGHEPIRGTLDTDDLRSAATLSIAGRHLAGSVAVQCVASLLRDCSAAETEAVLAGTATDFSYLNPPDSKAL